MSSLFTAVLLSVWARVSKTGKPKGHSAVPEASPAGGAVPVLLLPVIFDRGFPDEVGARVHSRVGRAAAPLGYTGL